MIWKTAWKNVWRNRVRSFVVIASVTTGVFAAVFSIAFMNGMIAQRFDAAINEEISHIQVTGKGFRLNSDPGIRINDVKNAIETIKNTPGVDAIVKRTITGGMASTANGSAGVEITGIDPSDERRVFTLDRTIIAGTGDFFTDESLKDQVVIGQDLAKELNIIRFYIDDKVISALDSLGVPSKVIAKLDSIKGKRFSGEKLFDKALKQILSKKESKDYFYLIKREAWSYRKGSRLTLTFLDRDNNQVGARFRIAGIYDTKNTIFEMSSVFVRNSDLKALTGYGEQDYNQIIARISNIDQTDEISKEIREKLSWAEVLSWKELRPDLAMMTDYVHQIYGILMVIIMAALAFGIVNTMLMVVLERTKELGMLTAIGMNKRKVFTMIMLESVFLSSIGGLIGMVASWFVILLTARNGINFIQYAEGMEAFGYSAHVFPEINSTFFIMMSVLVIVTGIISSIYPALKALRLNPVEAIRTE